MAYKMNPAQFAQVVSLPAEKRYLHFIGKVADWEELWTLKNSDGFVIFGDESGAKCVPVWPHPDYASALAAEDWHDCEPVLISLDVFMERWVCGMSRDCKQVVVFPTPDQKGVVIAPNDLAKDLSCEVEPQS